MEQVNTFDAPNPDAGLNEAEQQALARAEELKVKNDPERPEWLPEKFKTPEDLARSYKELEARMSRGEQPEEPQVEAEDVAEPAADPEVPATMDDLSENEAVAEAQELLGNKGLDFNDFYNEFAESGELSEESYANLQEAGFSKDFVNSWIAGQEALQAKQDAVVYESVGGQEAYKEVVTWAAENLPKGEIDAYNQAVSSGNIELAQLAASGLKAKYEAQAGRQPNLVKGEAPSTAGDIFGSTAELTAAIADPRYRTDEAYRRSVSDKLGRSRLFNKN